MTSHDFPGLNISQLMSSFMTKKYLYTTLLNVSDNSYSVMQYSDGPTGISTSGEYTVNILGNVEKYAHPMFVKQYRETYSLENLKKAYDADEEVHFQFLHLLSSDNKYHWVTKRCTPVHDNSGQKVFICTVENSDEEKAAADKNNQRNFNMAVINQLIYDYVLVHVVELDSSMSRLAHTKFDDFYHAYELQFPSHIAMMRHLSKNYVQPGGKEDFDKLIDYKYVKTQFDAGADRLICYFKDNREVDFKLTILKYPDYAPDNPLVIYAIKELKD